MYSVSQFSFARSGALEWSPAPAKIIINQNGYICRMADCLQKELLPLTQLCLKTVKENLTRVNCRRIATLN